MKFYTIFVKTKSKSPGIQLESEGVLKARLKSLPIKGKANEELKFLLSEFLKISKDKIVIKSGAKYKIKTVLVSE